MNEEQARKRVKEIRGFYGHLFSYILVNTGLVLINFTLTPDNLWFYWPMIGWGIGLAAHAFGLFGTDRIFGDEWEERKVRELMDKDRTRRT